jgi:protein TonB
MSPTFPESLRERLRSRMSRRGVAVVLALLFELLILLLFLTISASFKPKEKPKLVVFGVEDEGDKSEQKTQTKQQKAKPKSGGGQKAVQAPVVPPILTPPVPPEANSPSPVLWLTRQDYAAADIANKKGSAKADGDSSGDNSAPDSALAGGRGPHGEPLYAAQWYREPTDRELSPYIPERARGRGGWGIIACRTAPNYRVEDCQELDDSPRGSGYAGAVRQAAFQFRVKPPRVGGKPLVGSWVRILITYSVRAVHGDDARPGPQSDDDKPDNQ